MVRVGRGALRRFFVTAAAYGAPRVGLAFFVVVTIGGQLAVALLLDQIGPFGLARQPITSARILGILLVLSGVLLVRR